MQKEENINVSTCKPLPEVNKSVFFYGESKEFSNNELGITGEYHADSGKLEVRMPFERGAYFLFLDYWQLIISKQPNESDPFPLSSEEWVKKQINSDEDIPEECRSFCHYDEKNNMLVVTLSIPYDYALDYGTQCWCNCTYLQFMTGHRWRFLDRVTGG